MFRDCGPRPLGSLATPLSLLSTTIVARDADVLLLDVVVSVTMEFSDRERRGTSSGQKGQSAQLQVQGPRDVLQDQGENHRPASTIRSHVWRIHAIIVLYNIRENVHQVRSILLKQIS